MGVETGVETTVQGIGTGEEVVFSGKEGDVTADC